MNFSEMKNFYHNHLMETMDFWMKSDLVDKKYGGCITCIDREGRSYNNEKSGWFQGRCLWTFSALCKKYGIKENWMEAAEAAKSFLEKYCTDTDGRMYFTLAQDGTPIRKRRYFYSESFFVISMAEYGSLMNDKAALDAAEKCYQMMIDIYKDASADPFKITPKAYSNDCAAAVPMVLFSCSQILGRCIPEKAKHYSKITREIIDNMLRLHYDKDRNRIRETVKADGGFIDSPAGRTINPGHSCENAWFMMNYAVSSGDKELLKTALDILDGALEEGLDKEHGGIIYFSDIDGRPCDPLEWDMKLWWVHCEALIGTIYAYALTKEEKYLKQFESLHEYTFSHFPDKEFGEWYGYLHRDGTVSHTQKGSMWKGPYHLPRALMTIERIFEAIEKGETDFCIL